MNVHKPKSALKGVRFIIRPAKESDKSALWKLHQAAASEVGGSGWEDFPDAPHKMNIRRTFVAVGPRGCIQGMISVDESPIEVEYHDGKCEATCVGRMLHGLYVLPKHRGRGIGKALLNHAVSPSAHPLASNFLGIPINERAENILQRHGFKRVGIAIGKRINMGDIPIQIRCDTSHGKALPLYVKSR